MNSRQVLLFVLSLFLATGVMAATPGAVYSLNNGVSKVGAFPPHKSDDTFYGSSGNEDCAHMYFHNPLFGEIYTKYQIDLSTGSIEFINNNYIRLKHDSLPYAIYDFLTDMYSGTDFSEAMYVTKLTGDIDGDFQHLVNYIGSTHGLLNSRPAYFSFTVVDNGESNFVTKDFVTKANYHFHFASASRS